MTNIIRTLQFRDSVHVDMAALDAITTNPARIWGADDSVGSLEAGKDATFVIWNGDPLELTSYPHQVLIKGEIIDSQNRQQLLRNRYRTLTEDNQQPYSYR